MQNYVYRLCLISLITVLAGCATTHPRKVADLDNRAAKSKTFLILEPEIKVKMKYYDTDHYLLYHPRIKKAKKQFNNGFQDCFKELGYVAEVENFPKKYGVDKNISKQNMDQVKEYGNTKQVVVDQMKKAVKEIIYNDLEYNKPLLDKENIKTITAPLPQEWKNYDAVIFCYGSARLETDKECTNRWIKNVTFNVLLMPLAFVSYFVPIAVPLTLSTSTFVFKKSPDKGSFNFLIVDTKDKSIIYQNDYYINSLGFDDDEFYNISFDLMEDFPSTEDLIDKGLISPKQK